VRGLERRLGKEHAVVGQDADLVAGVYRVETGRRSAEDRPPPWVVGGPPPTADCRLRLLHRDRARLLHVRHTRERFLDGVLEARTCLVPWPGGTFRRCRLLLDGFLSWL
jgi:hypothetical protein